MRILFISPRQCWPTRSGARLREYYFLRALSQRADVTYVHFSDADPTLTRADLPFCREVVAVAKPARYTPAQLLQGVVSKWPLPVLNYTCPEMTGAVEGVLAGAPYDLVHLDSIHMIRYGEAAKAPIVYNWHNIESEAMRRFSSTVPSLAKRWYASHTAAKLAMLEKEILQNGFGHVVCSERERIQLNQIAPEARIRVVENGVDTKYYDGAGISETPGHQLVFIGAMDYHPNVEAATSFARTIWPAVRARIPNTKLLIVGANPLPAVQALQDLPGVTVTGTVPDVRPYYAGALAAIVPLRTGGGTRLKILEAMAAGVPVVSTPLGAEGLAVTAGRDILMADPDDAAKWIEHLSRLADTSVLRQQLTAAALDLVRTRYDWEMLGTILSETYAGWLRDAT